MKHNNWIFLLTTAILFGESVTLNTTEISQKKPHVIVIVADDLGWNDVSWNNPNVVMPNLNDLALNGVILNQSYVLPRCTPTRTALLTGRYPFTMGFQDANVKREEPRGIPLKVKLLPELLKMAGYSTHAVGKWHLGFCSWDYTPTRRGFDTFYGFYGGGEDHFTHKEPSRIEGIGRKKNKKRSKTAYLDLRNGTALDDTQEGVYSAHLFASTAEEIVRSRDPKDPMFMYLAFQSVHSPLQVPPEYEDVYKHIGNQNRRVKLGMVTAMDEGIGKVVKALKETGHYENSVIIFTTDNGGAIRHAGSNWPLRGGKGSFWEGGMRGPAMVHSPYLRNAGSVTDQLLHVTDWYSTIVSIAGGRAPTVDGLNQWDALAGIASPSRRKMIYTVEDFLNIKAGVRFADYKMLVGDIETDDWESIPLSEDGPLRPRNYRAQSYNETDEEATSTGTDYIQWKELESNQELKWKPKVRRILNNHLWSDTKIRLFNIKDDPEERNNLSAKESRRLQKMMIYLSKQLTRLVPSPSWKTDEASPFHWENAWSPGWCVAS
ncbi:arylsulfatase B-like [Macrobrachium rosenbergii]|uniref:arylsulfatase B-like n=1 Tax=Macrobrachium rosenbergii TaxID=79674 RepID=UPI0034D5217C